MAPRAMMLRICFSWTVWILSLAPISVALIAPRYRTSSESFTKRPRTHGTCGRRLVSNQLTFRTSVTGGGPYLPFKTRMGTLAHHFDRMLASGLIALGISRQVGHQFEKKDAAVRIARYDWPKTIVYSQGDRKCAWRDLLSPAQRAQVMALPASLREYEELYHAHSRGSGVRGSAPNQCEPAGCSSATVLPAVSRPSVDAGGNDAGSDAPVHRAAG
jgi:hypothetical protein